MSAEIFAVKSELKKLARCIDNYDRFQTTGAVAPKRRLNITAAIQDILQACRFVEPELVMNKT